MDSPVDSLEGRLKRRKIGPCIHARDVGSGRQIPRIPMADQPPGGDKRGGIEGRWDGGVAKDRETKPWL